MLVLSFFVLGLLCFITDHAVRTTSEKLVTSQLTTDWFAPPLILETSEFIQKYHPNYYWLIIEEISIKLDHINICHSDEYNIIVDILERYLSPTWLDYFKLVIGRHDFAPRIHLYRKLIDDFNMDGDCGSIFFVGRNTACDLDQAIALINNYENNEILHTVFDNYPTFKNNPTNKSSIIYYFGHIGTADFWTTYKSLKSYAENVASSVDFLIVPYSKKKCSMKVGMSNYGMSLSIKREKYDPEKDSLIDLIQYKNNSIFSKWLGLESTTLMDNQSNIDPGLNIEKLIEKYPDYSEELSTLKNQLYENSDSDSLYHLNENELDTFALSFISYAKNVKTMEKLTEIVSNLPSFTETIVQQGFPDSFNEESTQFLDFLSNFGLNTGVYLNGQELENLVGKKFEKSLMLETTIASMLSSFVGNSSLRNIDSADWNQLLQSQSKNLLESKRLTIKSSMVNWLNNLEKDVIYSYWPNSIVYMFQINFMGQLPNVAVNSYNWVSIIDPMDTNTKAILQSILSFLDSRVAIRFGLVINAKKNCKLSKLMASGFYFLASKNPKQATRFLVDVLGSRNKLNSKVIISTFSKYSKLNLENIHENSDPVNDRISEIQMDINDLGLKVGRSYFFLNGKMIDLNKRNEAVTRIISGETFKELFHLYQKFIQRKFSSIIQLIEYNEEFLKRINEDLIESPMFLNEVEFLSDKTKMNELLDPVRSKILVSNAKYTPPSDKGTNQEYGNLLIFANLGSSQGRQLVKTVVTHKSQTITGARFTFLFNDPYPKSKLTKNLHQLLQKSPNDLDETIESMFDQYEIDSVESASNLPLYQKLGLNSTDNAIVWNNKIFKLGDKAKLVGGDIELLLEMSKVPKSFVQNPDPDNKMKPAYRDTFSNWLTVIAGTLPKVARLLSKLEKLTSEFAPFVVNYDVRESAKGRFADFLTPHMVALIDPLAENSPRIFNQLNALYSSFSFKITLIMVPTMNLKTLPIDGFYRWCLPAKLEFDKITGYVQNPIISFINLPNDPLYTSNINIPPSWMIQNTYSNCDMDNIYLKMSPVGCDASYHLKYILIEGSSWYEKYIKPSSGIQYSLQDLNNHLYSDTLVMNNLGYFQLKSDVGIYRIVPKNTATSRFSISSITMEDNSNPISVILVDNFDGVNLEIIGIKSENFSSNDDMDDEDNESDTTTTNDSVGFGIFEKISNLFRPTPKSDSPPAKNDDTINIFSVATGSIYERFIRVMMLSVVKTTKKPVKFWLLRNYLSANFIDSVKLMAKKYNFEYDFVQYQWPKWLNDQKEKRRIIWGYKILFLDVMFPLHVKRIIFVDADQVVRADLNQLNKMNLGKAPYAYTPFCNDRPEVEQLRFWQGGYWKSLLRGKPYHISALYVVDLVKFRKMAVGDRLRAHYQSLSEDPNSLANLDQDLPNSLIHEVPIKSLPPEWLWCETWCSDSTKKSAKSIDLCGNPMTNESKWNSALRIIPEFAGYDNEIENLLHPLPLNATTTTPTVPVYQQQYANDEL